jgi:alpha-2-macroglobulin
MSRLSVRSAVQAVAFLACASLSLVCSPTRAPQTQNQAEAVSAELLHRPSPKPGSLVFPPDDPDAWSARRGLDGSASTAELKIVEPTLDADGKFTLDGQVLRVVFSEAVAPHASWRILSVPAKDALVVTPAVPGKLAWADERTLEFRASKPFDPNATFEVRVNDSATSGSKKLASGWQASFHAVPRIDVAGKVINYLPKPGSPRVIAVHPMTGETVGRSPELGVVFDQPIDLARAKALIELTSDGKNLGFGLRHPAGPSYQGVSLDARLVVLVKPFAALAAKEGLTISAKDGAENPGPPQERSFTVASPLVMTDVRCEQYGAARDGCDVNGDHLRTRGQQVNVVFNNPIGMSDKDLLSHVSVTPWVRNLRVTHEFWDQTRVTISGDLRPSTTYRVAMTGLVDAYGGRLGDPVRLAVDTTPLPASLSMPEGAILLDTKDARTVPLTTRNVEEVEVAAWEVPEGDTGAFHRAVASARLHQTPAGEPTRIAVPIAVRRDTLVKTDLDLSSKLTPGRLYVVSARSSKVSFYAPDSSYDTGAEASHPPVALVTVSAGHTLAVHARAMPGATLIHVARLGSGEPVPGAKVSMGSFVADTDATGVALLRGERDLDAVVSVQAGDDRAMLALAEGGIGAKELFPDVSVDAEAPLPALRAVVLSDRGVYRPGSTVMVKGNVRTPDGDKLLAVSNARVRVKLVDPSGGVVFSDVLTTSEEGSVDTKIAVDSGAKIGRYRLELEEENKSEPALAESIVQVADFEPPRFKVDVEPEKGKGEDADAKRLKATISAKYLFGAAMDHAFVTWTLHRKTTDFPHGPLTDAGLLFRRRRFWYDDGDGSASSTRSGEGVLAADGTLKVDAALALDESEGPQDFTLEADVADSSYRHVAGRVSVTKNPLSHYAGLQVDESWVGVGASVPVKLGVIDTDGKSVQGVPVTARLVRVDWTFTSHRGASGALETRWVERSTDVGGCSATSEERPVVCSLKIPTSGDYQIRAEAFGKPGGVTSLWAWSEGDSQRTPFPTKGRTIEVRTDKGSYKPGESARVLVRNPYPAATAILTTEQGGLLAYEAKRVNDPAVAFEVPIRVASAPFVHAVVTLLPIGAKGEGATDSKIGAVRIQVAEDDLRLKVTVKSNKPTYLPGEDAELSVDVADGQSPDGTAEITLAVVDEGVLRLTSFHASDPTNAFHKGMPLFFRAYDTRQDLSDWLNRSHVAGDGGGEEGAASLVAARRNFVQTALWVPDLHTDANGHATTKLHLPDNLTEFRMMAVVVDRAGKAAASEASFTVRKPLMMVPIVPRFALVGDNFEAAAMLHNNTSDPVDATVTLMARRGDSRETTGDRTVHVSVPAEGHERVSFPVTAEQGGDKVFTLVLSAAGKDVDKVESKVRFDEPGYDERPKIAGTFVGSDDVDLKLPNDLVLRGDEMVSVEMGENLWPELGARLEYLLQYPHGCVEQTTSSTLPLLAARTILPRIGFRGLSEAELDKRIRVGMARYESMKTSSGGLAYWPGGAEPNVFGTAYAIRAVILARAAGIETPTGLLEGMQSYLNDVMLSASNGPEVEAAIAQSLADIGTLRLSTADALFDTRSKQSVFGLGSLALALHALPGQEDRVAQILNDLEASFGDQGQLLKNPTAQDFYYYGSPSRSRSQAAIALTRLRPASKLAEGLVESLAADVEGYTTQATAWSLLAVASRLGGKPKAGVEVSASLDGVPLASATDLDFGSKEFRVPVKDLVGRTAKLHLESRSGVAVGYMIKSHWKRNPSAAGAHVASHTSNGPEVYRVYTDPHGRPADMSQVHAGDVVRVLLVAKLPETSVVARGRRGYVALTDRIAAGFEPIDPDLATVAKPADLDDSMPFAGIFREQGGSADHVELHDDRVNIYFDHPWGDFVTASYLIRATTPGTFLLPPASGELMYEPSSEGYSETGTVKVLGHT